MKRILFLLAALAAVFVGAPFVGADDPSDASAVSVQGVVPTSYSADVMVQYTDGGWAVVGNIGAPSGGAASATFGTGGGAVSAVFVIEGDGEVIQLEPSPIPDGGWILE